MSALLEVQKVCKAFRGVRALADVSLTVAPASLTALIGPNGAGKSTLFNLVAGAMKPDRGTIVFDGKRIDGLRPHRICAFGIARTFQIVKPFSGLSVLDNVTVGALKRASNVSEARAHARTILENLGLGTLSGAPAAALTLPDRRRLEVARAIATRPRLLLLDEALAGLLPAECEQMIEFLRDVHRRDGVAILMIEHVMHAVMALAETVVVLHQGEVIARGAPKRIVREPAVLECYLGEGPVP